MEPEEKYMRRCMELATLGKGNVSPNPLVGCVIVTNGEIIGEGYHRKFGLPHAEPNALASVADKYKLREATLYVNLEPCAHFGKTPPCADAIIRAGIPRVVVANRDPFPQVAGRGLEKLRAAGIEVITGMLEQEGRELNKRFFTFYEKNRPWIVLKWAQTQDGFLSRTDFNSRWISNQYSRLLVHQWRTQEDSILAGYRTALHDNPQLTARDMGARNPIRLVLDRDGTLPRSYNLFDGAAQTFVFTANPEAEYPNAEAISLHYDRNPVQELLYILYERKIQSVLVEGGAAVLGAFMECGLWDEARVFESHTQFVTGIKAPEIHGRIVSSGKIGNDTVCIYRNDGAL